MLAVSCGQVSHWRWRVWPSAGGRSARLLAWLKEIGVPMNNPPRCVLAAEYVRHTQRCLADIGTVIESSAAAFNVNRICAVLVCALSEILLVKPAL